MLRRREVFDSFVLQSLVSGRLISLTGREGWARRLTDAVDSWIMPLFAVDYAQCQSIFVQSWAP
jgi:hypothetical protein